GDAESGVEAVYGLGERWLLGFGSGAHRESSRTGRPAMKQEARPGDGLESPSFSRGEEVKVSPLGGVGCVLSPRLDPLPRRCALGVGRAAPGVGAGGCYSLSSAAKPPFSPPWCVGWGGGAVGRPGVGGPPRGS